MKKVHLFIITILIFSVLTGCGGIAINLGDESTNSASMDAENSGQNGEAQNEPAVEDDSGDLIPDGVLVGTGSETSLNYLDTTGQYLQDIQTPGINNADSEEVIIAGAVPADGTFPPVIFHSWQPEQALMVNRNGQVEKLRDSTAFLAMAGAPGQPAVSFSEVSLNTENNPHSFLYAGKPDTISSIPSFYDLVDEPFYWALKPVGIKTTAGEVQGVWYVKTAWGIGGADLIFPINRGLYFYDLTNGDNLRYLDDERSLQGISPDLSFAASVETDISGDRSMKALNLITNKNTSFALDPLSDRGAGFAVFSPDNHFIAWLEATGSMISDPYDFHPRVRIGDIQTGNVIEVVDDIAAAQIINGVSVTMMRPVGWLDNETVIIEVRGQNWGDVTLLHFNVSTTSLTMFASGEFLAFGYR